MSQATRLECPSCKSVLKSANPIPAGKKVKCPKCGTTIEVHLVPPVASFTSFASDTAQPPPTTVSDSSSQPTNATKAKPSAFLYTHAVNSSAALFLTCGLWIAGSALVTLNGDSDWYGRGPNLIIENDALRSARFQSMFSTVLAAGIALAAVGGLIPLRQRWIYILGFPIVIAVGLIFASAQFASNSQFIWILATAFTAMVLCADLVWLLYCAHQAKVESEFLGLRGDQGGIESLIDLLQHPKRGIRLETIRELKGMGAAAAPAVPSLVETLLKQTPLDLNREGVCLVCGEKLSVWTKDKVKTPDYPDGVAACLGCRKRLVDGAPSESQFVVETLAAIGPGARSAIPALRKVAGCVDPLLRNACRGAIQTIQRNA